MEPAQFWSFIETARAQTKGNSSVFLEALKGALLAQQPDVIVDFQTALDERISFANTADLWGAAYVIGGGCSDHGFTYFRAWLVTQGQAVFERAVRVPDSLAELPRQQETELEDMLSLASTAYNERTGELDFYDRLPTMSSSLKGELWSDDKDLLTLFPKLAAKYDFAG